jgi:hypothetical protein
MEITSIRIMDNPTHLIKKSFPSFSISFVIATILSFLLTMLSFGLKTIFQKTVFSPYEPKIIDADKDSVILLKHGGNNVSGKYIKSFINNNPSRKVVTVVDTSDKSSTSTYLKDQLTHKKEFCILNIHVSDQFNENTDESLKIDGSDININSDFSANVLSCESFLRKIDDLSEKHSQVLLFISSRNIEDLPEKLFDISDSSLFSIKVGETKRSNLWFLSEIYKRINGCILTVVED